MQTPKRKPNPYDLIPPDYHVSQEKYDSFVREFEKLEKRVRPKVIEEMQAAAEHGDFSENHAYQMAKWRVRGINGRLEKLKKKIDNAIIIEKNIQSDTVQIGSTVVVEVNGMEKEYQILGAEEVDPLIGKISHLSPLGKVLLGHSKGDKVEAEIGDSIKVYTIISIG